MKRRMLRLASTSRPSVGSSRNRISGSCSSASPRAARVRRQEAGEQLDRGALPGAVRAGVGDGFAAADPQVDVLQRLDLADGGVKELAEGGADALRALLLPERLGDARQLNDDVRS